MVRGTRRSVDVRSHLRALVPGREYVMLLGTGREAGGAAANSMLPAAFLTRCVPSRGG